MQILTLWATDTGSLPIPTAFGVASLPLAIMAIALRWCLSQMSKKDDAIDRLNEQASRSNDQSIKQVERLVPLITEASRVLSQATDALAPSRYKDRA